MPKNEPVCIRCSKPVRPGTGQRVGSAAVHVRCAAHATMLEALEAQARAQESQARTMSLLDATRDVVSASQSVTLCSACSRSLASGGGLLYQGDRLVHALCWRPASAPAQPPAAADGDSGSALQLLVGRVGTLDRRRRRLTVGSREFDVEMAVSLDELKPGMSVRVLYEAAAPTPRVLEIRAL